MLFWVLFCFVLSTSAIREAVGIGCYVCDSHEDPGCDKDPVDERYRRDCFQLFDGQNYDRCRKVTQWLENHSESTGHPNERVVRSCGWASWSDLEDSQSCRDKSSLSGRQLVCTCNVNYCNGASGVHGHQVHTALALFAFTLYIIISHCH